LDDVAITITIAFFLVNIRFSHRVITYFMDNLRLKLQQKLVRAGQEMLNIMAETDGAITIPESNVVVHILNRTDDTNIPNYGMRPTKSSIVKMHYHGTLADGTIFESSYVATKSSDSDSNSNKNTIEPVNVPIAKLVPGLRDGMVQHMTVGDTAMIGVPPVVGYGIITTPPNPNVPDNSTLFYKVQLVDVLTAGIGGSEQNVPTLLNADGTKLSSSTSSTLLGANGRPLI
jgi:FKBP-type peptidyl-prolyl cis-trans isomerase